MRAMRSKEMKKETRASKSINIKGRGWAIVDGEYIVYDKKDNGNKR